MQAPQMIRLNVGPGPEVALHVAAPPEGTPPPRRLVLIASAMATPARFYHAYAQWLATRGCVVVACDVRGIGDAVGDPAPRSLKELQVDLVTWATVDLQAVLDWCRTQYPHLPITYLGHSFGGQAFGLLQRTAPVDRVLTVAAGSGYWGTNAKPLKYYAWFLWKVLAPLSIARAGYFPGKRLGVIGDMPAGSMQQWGRWAMHRRYLGSEKRPVLGQPIHHHYDRVQQPITAVMAIDDEMISPQGVRDLYRHYRHTHTEFIELRPHEWGLAQLGHFGFFRASLAEGKLWPASLAWLGLHTSSTSTTNPHPT